VTGVVAFLMELYCISRYINATGCLNTILQAWMLFFNGMKEHEHDNMCHYDFICAKVVRTWD
jgi:hypothetical protein